MKKKMNFPRIVDATNVVNFVAKTLDFREILRALSQTNNLLN